MRAMGAGFSLRSVTGGRGSHTDSLFALRIAFSSSFIDWNRFSASGSMHLWIASRMAGLIFG